MTANRSDRSDGPLPKPTELLGLGPACTGLFKCLQRWFNVGPQLVADISTIGSPAIAEELQDPQLVAGFAMRRLQALHFVSRPGVRTTTDIVIALIDGVLRPLIESPTRHLTQASTDVDWDHA
jgi:hypothetical protein